jgi:hypothetical protein
LRRAQGDEAGALGFWKQALDALESSPQLPTVEALDIRARTLLLLGRARSARPIVAKLDGFGWRNPELAALSTPAKSAK